MLVKKVPRLLSPNKFGFIGNETQLSGSTDTDSFPSMCTNKHDHSPWVAIGLDC